MSNQGAGYNNKPSSGIAGGGGLNAFNVPKYGGGGIGSGSGIGGGIGGGIGLSGGLGSYGSSNGLGGGIGSSSGLRGSGIGSMGYGGNNRMASRESKNRSNSRQGSGAIGGRHSYGNGIPKN